MIKRYFILIVFALMAIFVKGYSQSFSIGNSTLNLVDTNRSNRAIAVQLYYPADVAGQDVPVASGSFPVIIFGHGFAMSYTSYSNIWSFLIPKGYVLGFVDTENGIIPSPNHEAYGRDILFCGKEILRKGQNESGFMLFGKHNGKTAFAGHSMGGGASILAASYEPAFPDALIGLAPAETTPSAISAATQVIAKTVIFSGTNDKVTPPADHHIPIYNGLASSCKFLINITGGAHCYFADTDLACDFGETTSGSNPTITRAQQQTIANGMMAEWFDYTLKSNAGAIPVFQNLLGASSITYLTNCSAFNTGLETGNTIQEMEYISPNPAVDYIRINKLTENFDFAIFDLQGKKLKSGKTQFQNQQLDVSELPSGIYFVKISSLSDSKTLKVVKK